MDGMWKPQKGFYTRRQNRAKDQIKKTRLHVARSMCLFVRLIKHLADAAREVPVIRRRRVADPHGSRYCAVFPGNGQGDATGKWALRLVPRQAANGNDVRYIPPQATLPKLGSVAI